MPTASAKRKFASRKRAKSAPQTAGAAWPLRRAARLQVLGAPALRRLGWLVHGFSTRAGGASELSPPPQQKVLNLGFTDWDSRSRVLDNRKRFFRAMGAAELPVMTLRQIHSDVIHVVDSSNVGAEIPQADALLTREPGVLLAVQTADCVPILLADPKNRAIAAIHAGWRGALRRIAAKALGRMQMEFGTRPEDVIAALGPAIGRCCYEVGPEVAREFHAQFAGAQDFFDGPVAALATHDNDPNWLPWLSMAPPGHTPPAPRVYLDLIAANRAILAEAGASPKNIFSSGYCTACRTDLFFSYRRERSTGRMMAAIAIR